MFRTFPLSIIRSFTMYTQQWFMSYRFAVYTVKNSWWWTEELSETCRVLFQKWIWEICLSSWFYYKNLRVQMRNGIRNKKLTPWGGGGGPRVAQKYQIHTQRPVTLSGEHSGHFSETFVTRVLSKQNRCLSKTLGRAMTAGDLVGHYTGPPLRQVWFTKCLQATNKVPTVTHDVHSNKCTGIKYSNIKTWGNPHFLAFLRDVINKEKHNNIYLCHRYAITYLWHE